jgi:two-component system, cell cycle response regulator DivK
MMTKILCIDDNALIRKLFRFLLEKSGYQVFEAENGARGIQVCRTVLPDLILMDVQMPVMDGITALKLILSREATRQIPVIATTSYAMKGDRERFLGEGFAAYLSKPFDNDRLLLQIKISLERSQGDGEEKEYPLPLGVTLTSARIKLPVSLPFPGEINQPSSVSEGIK